MTDAIDMTIIYRAMQALRDAAMPLRSHQDGSAEILAARLRMPHIFTLIDAQNRKGDRLYAYWPCIALGDADDDDARDRVWWMVVDVLHFDLFGLQRKETKLSLDRDEHARQLLAMTEDTPGAAAHLLVTLQEATRWVARWTAASVPRREMRRGEQYVG